jgi:hypothetical protein
MNHLLATCDRVLQIRAEVPEAVAATLRRATPDKLEQFELLLQDHRSIRKLADETLNDENVVTAENAEHLLDVMRQATADEVRIKFESVMKEEQARHRELQRKNRERLEKSEAERADAVGQVGSLRLQQNKVIAAVLQSINSQLEAIANSISALMLVVVVVAIAQYLFGWLEDSFFWKMVLNISGLLGAYHLVMALLGKPMLNLTSILNLIAPKLLERKLAQLNLDHLSLDDFEFRNGQVFQKPRG